MLYAIARDVMGVPASSINCYVSWLYTGETHPDWAPSLNLDKVYVNAKSAMDRESRITLDSDSDTTYNGVCSTLLNNCEEGTLTEIGHQEDAEHSTPGGLTHTINQK
ncbi:hypothetical protein OUZ56_016747 [Daphnia magna]|uniref:Uncharacterized protein n=1 Tax=Daphnia magna TaxID=35525 RepID=A0ABR0ARF7_9CRUS|nr:hypothetical protein OUZ56_016747 [Daphnia magna]